MKNAKKFLVSALMVILLLAVASFGDYTQALIDFSVDASAQAELSDEGQGNFVSYEKETVRSTAALNTNSVVEPLKITASTTYSLFNSGSTSSTGNFGTDYAPETYTNNGKDIYACNWYGSDTERLTRLGLSFSVDRKIKEDVGINIYAFDVDESSNETDHIYLVDETDGTRVKVGTLSGMDWTWTNTTFKISPDKFQKGHVYHFELEVYVVGWEVAIRTVSMSVNAVENGDVVKQEILDASVEATIDSSRVVTPELTVVSSTDETYDVEFKATHIATNNQLGSLVDGVIEAKTTGTTKTYTFTLLSGSPSGIYQIDAYIKKGNDIIKSCSCKAGYNALAVSYNSNGGTNNLPDDDTAYSTGETVDVLFDKIPSKTGYIFLGWATSKDADAPDYTIYGTKSFIIGDESATLYAVWAEDNGDTLKLGKPDVTATTTATTATLKWTKVKNATGYRVYQKIDGKWVKKGNTQKNSGTIKGLTPKTKYEFAVRAYNITGSVVTWADSYGKVDATTKALKLEYIKYAYNARDIKLMWSEVEDATGYRIYYRTNTKNPWTVAKKATAKTTQFFVGLKSGKSYQFAVRPFVIINDAVVWGDYRAIMTSTAPSEVKLNVISASKGRIDLSWNKVDGATGYKIYYKLGNGNYKVYDCVTVNKLSFRNIKSGSVYTFVVRPYRVANGITHYAKYTPVSVKVK